MSEGVQILCICSKSRQSCLKVVVVTGCSSSIWVHTVTPCIWFPCHMASLTCLRFKQPVLSIMVQIRITRSELKSSVGRMEIALGLKQRQLIIRPIQEVQRHRCTSSKVWNTEIHFCYKSFRKYPILLISVHKKTSSRSSFQPTVCCVMPEGRIIIAHLLLSYMKNYYAGNVTQLTLLDANLATSSTSLQEIWSLLSKNTIFYATYLNVLISMSHR